MTRGRYQYFPTEGTPFAKCFQDCRTYRNYTYITFDLWRSDRDLNSTGSKLVGGFYKKYLDQWRESYKNKIVPYPKIGISWSPEPKDLVYWCVLKEDREMMADTLWDFIRNDDNTVLLRSGLKFNGPNKCERPGCLKPGDRPYRIQGHKKYSFLCNDCILLAQKIDWDGLNKDG